MEVLYRGGSSPRPQLGSKGNMIGKRHNRHDRSHSIAEQLLTQRPWGDNRPFQFGREKGLVHLILLYLYLYLYSNKEKTKKGGGSKLNILLC